MKTPEAFLVIVKYLISLLGSFNARVTAELIIHLFIEHFLSSSSECQCTGCWIPAPEDTEVNKVSVPWNLNFRKANHEDK